MITSHIVDRAKFEKARASHLSLLRQAFDKAPNYSTQYDICSEARLYYDSHPLVEQMENDLAHSDKPKF